jgi:hypothetical protein
MSNSNTLKIQIVKDHNELESRIFEASNGKPERKVFKQTGYMFNGGAFPVKFKFGIPDEKSALPVGDYTLLISAFNTDKYDGLALETFNLFDHIAPVVK